MEGYDPTKPPPKRGPGRPPKKAALVATAAARELACILHELDGVAVKRAEVFLRLEAGGTRDEINAWLGQIRILRDVEAVALKRAEIAESTALRCKLDETNKQLSGRQGNALRADVAIAPRQARSAESDQ